MKMKQISIFVENRPGRLRDMLEVLSDNEINIRALSVADSADFGIVRIILSDVSKGLEVLRAAGFTTSSTDVIRAEMPDTPGGLLKSVVEPLAEAEVNIEYFYAFVDSPLEKASVVLKVSDPDKAAKVLGS